MRANCELEADDPGIADESGIVVEVDAALQVRLVGDVAGVSGDLIVLGREIVADPKPAFVIAVGVELRRLVEEEVGVALQPPIGIGEDLAAVGERNPVARRQCQHVVGRLRERITIQVGVAQAVRRIGDGALGADRCLQGLCPRLGWVQPPPP